MPAPSTTAREDDREGIATLTELRAWDREMNAVIDAKLKQMEGDLAPTCDRG